MGGGESYTTTYIHKTKPGTVVEDTVLKFCFVFNKNYVFNIKKDESLLTIKLNQYPVLNTAA